MKAIHEISKDRISHIDAVRNMATHAAEHPVYVDNAYLLT